jgi:hypothetical protein
MAGYTGLFDSILGEGNGMSGFLNETFTPIENQEIADIGTVLSLGTLPPGVGEAAAGAGEIAAAGANSAGGLLNAGSEIASSIGTNGFANTAGSLLDKAQTQIGSMTNNFGSQFTDAYKNNGMSGVADVAINKATGQFNANPVVQFGQKVFNPNSTTNDLTSSAWKMFSSDGGGSMPSLMPQLMPSMSSIQPIKPINQSNIPSMMQGYNRGLLPYSGR